MLKSFVLGALLGVSSVLAAETECNVNKRCPEESPCCSQYGECGVGAYCLGGCDPRSSFSLDACVPAPVCQDRDITFDSLDRIKDISEYLGDPEKADFVASGEPALHDNNVLLTMPKGSSGTVLSTTTYMWYGNVKARIKTSRGRGVITGFILFSDVQDEIDFEWVGVDLSTAQTNFYTQGIPNYKNSKNITDLSDTFKEFHDYEIRWTPDKIEWFVDGELGRSKDRKDTWNATGNRWDFPQTPARVQLSLWPGGREDNPQGTIEWAGGVIDWNSADIQQVGFYYATLESLKIECYNADSPPGTNKGKSYTYKEGAYTNDTVIDGDKDTIIASLDATGLDMDAGAPAEDTSDEQTSGARPSSTHLQVPGGSNPVDDHADDNGGGDSGDNGSDSSGSVPSGDDCPIGSFCQGGSSNSNNNNDDNSGAKSKASALAIIIAGFALYWL